MHYIETFCAHIKDPNPQEENQEGEEEEKSWLNQTNI